MLANGTAMDNPFDIFKKESVAELSQESPGEYRVFDKRTGKVIPSEEPLQAGRGTSH